MLEHHLHDDHLHGHRRATAAASFVSLCFAVEQHWLFGHFITLIILVVAVLIGVETDYGTPGPAVRALNYVFLGIFVGEVLVKTGANAILPGTTAAEAFRRYLSDHWNQFGETMRCNLSG